MAWQEPYTEWSAGDSVTYEDMNRITGNLNYLLNSETLPEYGEHGVLWLTGWNSILAAVEQVRRDLGMEQAEITNETTAVNFSELETFIYEAYLKRSELERQAAHYANENFANEIYIGGYEHV